MLAIRAARDLLMPRLRSPSYERATRTRNVHEAFQRRPPVRPSRDRARDGRRTHYLSGLTGKMLRSNVDFRTPANEQYHAAAAVARPK